MATVFRHNEIENIRVKKLNDAYALLLTKQPLDQQLTDLAALVYTGKAGRPLKVNEAGTGLEIDYVRYGVATQGATYTETATSGEKLIKVSGTMTVNLPTAVGNTAKLHFKLTAAGTVTIDAFGTETIDGALTQTLSAANQSFTMMSDNANWWLLF